MCGSLRPSVASSQGTRQSKTKEFYRSVRAFCCGIGGGDRAEGLGDKPALCSRDGKCGAGGWVGRKRNNIFEEAGEGSEPKAEPLAAT